MIYAIDIGPNLFQLLQLYFVVRYVVPALVGGALLVVAMFFVRYLLRQPDLDWGDITVWKFAAIGAVVGLVLTFAVLAPHGIRRRARESYSTGVQSTRRHFRT